jgi:hypothetical protein
VSAGTIYLLTFIQVLQKSLNIFTWLLGLIIMAPFYACYLIAVLIQNDGHTHPPPTTTSLVHYRIHFILTMSWIS